MKLDRMLNQFIKWKCFSMFRGDRHSTTIGEWARWWVERFPKRCMVIEGGDADLKFLNRARENKYRVVGVAEVETDFRASEWNEKLQSLRVCERSYPDLKFAVLCVSVMGDQDPSVLRMCGKRMRILSKHSRAFWILYVLVYERKEDGRVEGVHQSFWKHRIFQSFWVVFKDGKKLAKASENCPNWQYCLKHQAQECHMNYWMAAGILESYRCCGCDACVLLRHRMGCGDACFIRRRWPQYRDDEKMLSRIGKPELYAAMIDRLPRYKEELSRKPVIKFKTMRALVDMYEESDYMTVIAKIPDVDENINENNIEVSISSNTLKIEVNTPAGIKYFEKVDLPKPISTFQKSYKNRVLEIRLKKA